MTAPLQVLVVEDSDDDAQLVVREIRKGGYDLRYERVDNEETMRAALQRTDWDVVIADHNMPRFNSLEALRIVKELGLDLPFVIVSASIGEDVAVEAMKAGAHDYIMKGKLARLVPAVERELREAMVRRAGRQAEALLRYHANHDGLTGLVNRREFESRVNRAVHSARTENREYALGYMDLDQFKIVNDTCGHVAGDELLKQLAVLLREHFRENDTLARLGGDEFGLLLENCHADQALRIAENLLKYIHNFRFSWLDKSFEVGASVGLVMISRESGSATQLLSTADVACYAAKDMGRNRVHLYQPDDAELARRHGEMQWVAHITKAIDKSRFRLYRQNIVSLQNGKIAEHYEVLIRMLDDEGNSIPPGAFIPAAERYNLMPAIDRWVVAHAIEHLAERIRKSEDLRSTICTINLSGTTLNDHTFVGFLRQLLRDAALPGESICFEVTETAAIASLSNAVSFINEVREFGAAFSLDDFGSGLSSFAYLKTLPVQYLKIDGSFIRDIVVDPISRAMVEAITKIGHVMGLRTIAECIEDDGVLSAVRSMGIDYGQGYRLHRPEPMTGVRY